MIASLLIIVCLLSGVVALVLYTLNKQATWKVNIAYGLKLTDQYDTEIISIDFVVDRFSTQSKTFKLKNMSNNAVNVTQIMPLSTAYYDFTTTFVNCTIAKDGFVLFNVVLQDIDMDASTTYSGQFSWLIVDHFQLADEQPEPKIWLEASEIVYADDTTPYLQFVSESFDKTVYNASESVQYSFTTKNPSDTYILQAYSYQLDVFNSSGFQCQVFNGMSGSMLGLLKDQTNTIAHVFNAPNVNGSYYLKLTYTGHNSEVIPPPTYTYTIEIHNYQKQTISQVVVTGFTYRSQPSSIHFEVRNNEGFNVIDAVQVNILGISPNLFYTEVTINKGTTWFSPTINFSSPSTFGNYIIQIWVCYA